MQLTEPPMKVLAVLLLVPPPSLTASQRQRIGRLLNYGHTPQAIAERVGVSLHLVLDYMANRWRAKERTKGTKGKFPGDGRRRSEYAPLDRVILIPDSELADVESVVGIVLMTCERRCLVEFPTKVGWYCENQLLLAPTAGLIQAKCDELRRRWSPSDIRLVRAERERQVEVRE